MDWIDNSRFVWFLRLACRPHPYARPCFPWWRAWTDHFVGPREAWRIAGVLTEGAAVGE